ncbi:hypothetical protein DXD76_15550 [Firmicutes bacterium TM09-10]|nr:hypothetical protein DXD76_15550 [Firmicutes bacterium TM09-10]
MADEKYSNHIFFLSKCAFLLPFAAICAVLILLYVSVISVQKMQILAKYCKMCTAKVVETE